MAPSLGLNPDTRAALLEEAVRLVKHVGYRNAGAHEHTEHTQADGLSWNEPAETCDPTALLQD